jgi:hypothetical protein
MISGIWQSYGMKSAGVGAGAGAGAGAGTRSASMVRIAFTHWAMHLVATLCTLVLMSYSTLP